jgi:uncharacterized lipoprotein YddW (UPF0748 family)
MKRLAVAICVSMVLLPAISPSDEAGHASTGVRAAWVTRWAFKSPEDVRGIFASLADAGINTVFFQVRGACDALYRSSLEPWSDLLTGTLGKDPRWDPLAVALEEGRRRGLEVHAWVNVFTAWPVTDSGTPPPVTNPPHVYRAHPDWLAVDASGRRMSLVRAETRHNYAFLSPTNDGVEDYITAVISDLVGHYEVAGIHFDYVRFPDSSYSYDPGSRAAYRLDRLLIEPGGDTLSFREWRTRSLDDFVGRLSHAAREARPGIKVSAAVWQKIGDGREVYLQNGPEWTHRGYLDFVVPMIYTPSVEAFAERLGAYTGSVGASRVVAGSGPYLEAFTDSILAGELDAVEAAGALGYAIFNSDFAVRYADVLRAYAAEHPR